MTDPEMRRAIDRLAAEVARIGSQVRAQGRAQRRPQLAHSSLEEGQSLEVRGPGGTRSRIGWLPDGTVGMVTEGGDPVSAPTAPTVTPSLGGLRITWDGQLSGDLALPGDFDHMAVHVSTTAGFEPSAATHVGTIRRAGEGGMLPVVPLPYVEHYVVLVPVTTGGITGDPSAEVAGTPLQSGAADLQAGSVEAVHISAGAVTADKLEAVLVLVSTIVAGIPGAARVELDTDGIRGYDDAGALVFAVDSSGNAVFSGDVTSSTITGSEVIVGELAGAHARLYEPLPGEPTLYMVGTSGADLTIAASNIPRIDLGPRNSTTQPYISMFAYPDSTGWLNRSPSGAAVDIRTTEENAQVILNAPASTQGNGAPGSGVVYGLRKTVGDLAALSIQGPWQVFGVGANRLAMIDLESANANRNATQATHFAAQHVFTGGITGDQIETTPGVVSIGATHSLLAPRHAPVQTTLQAQPTGSGSDSDWVDFTEAQFPSLDFTTGWSGRVKITVQQTGASNVTAGATLSTSFRLSGGYTLAADLSRSAMSRAAAPRGDNDNGNLYAFQQQQVFILNLPGLADITLTPAWRTSGIPTWGSSVYYDMLYGTAIIVENLM